MGSQLCPLCKEGFLIRYGSKRRSRPQKRCRICGYWQNDSGNKLKTYVQSPPDVQDIIDVEVRKALEKRLEDEQMKEKKPLKFLDESSRDKREPSRKEIIEARNKTIRTENWNKSIEKILNKMRKDKYHPLLGETIYFFDPEGKRRGFKI